MGQNDIILNSPGRPPLILVDPTVTDIKYIGVAPAGTLQSQAKWQITKVDKTGVIISVKHANGGSFTATWDNRASETYS